MFNVGGGEMVMLAILALLVFGPEGLPEIVKTVTRTMRAFKQAANDFQSEVNTALTLENEKRVVQERRRKRARPLEEKLAESESSATPLLAQETTPEPEAVEAEIFPATPDNNSPASDEVLDNDDDDGPGLPMSRPARPDTTSEPIAAESSGASSSEPTA